MDYFSDHRFDIKKYEHWTLVLNYNQSYLGRAICYLNTYKENLTDLTPEELLEFQAIVKAYQSTLTQLWEPDWWNYAQLGNETPHLHFHLIPRYKTPRTFAGEAFVDEHFGKNYVPAPERLMNEEFNKKIVQAIREKI